MAHRVKLEIRTYGGLQVEVAGSTVELRERSARRLIAFLVLQRGATKARDTLIAQLWPDSDEASGRRALRQGLWYLRRELGLAAGRLRVLNDTIALRLENGDRIDLDHPVESVRGEFLEGWTDEWVLEARHTLTATNLDRLEALALEAEHEHRWEDALALAQVALKTDGLREAMHRTVIRTHLHRGERHRALVQFQTLQELLQDLGVDAEPETQLLMRRALPSASATDAAALERSAFIGRQAERAVLRNALLTSPSEAGSRSRGGRVIWVEGEGGIGKTRLVDEFAQEATRTGVAVFWGDCDEGAGDAFQSLIRALNAGLDETKSLWLKAHLTQPTLAVLRDRFERLCTALDNPSLANSAAPSAVSMGAALLQTFGQLAALGPTILVLDDVQCADRATLAWLLALAEAPEVLCFDLVLISRVVPASADAMPTSLAQRLAESLPLVALFLEPLEPLNAASLVTQVTEDEPRKREALLHGRGNPLMLLELARYPSEGAGDSSLGARFAQQVSARLRGLDPATRGFLERLAVIPQRVKLETLLLEDGFEALRHVEALGRLGLVYSRADLGTVEVAHAALRAVIKASLEPDNPSWRALHDAALRLLRRDATASSALLAQLAEASQQWLEAARQCLIAARQASAAHAHELVLEHTERGLQLLEQSGDDTIDDALRRIRIPALEALGHWDNLVTASQDLQARAKNDVDFVWLEATAARALLRLGKFAAAQTLASNAVQRAGDDPEARWIGVSTAGLVAFRSGDLEAALRARRQAVKLAGSLSLERRAESVYLLANTLIEAGELEEAKSSLAWVARIQRAGNPAAYADAVARLGVVWTLTHHPKRAEAAYSVALDGYRLTGKRQAMASTLNSLASLQRDLGQVALALETHERALNMYRAMRDRVGEVGTQLNLAVLHALEFGDAEAANAQLNEVEERETSLLRASGRAMIVYIRACLESQPEVAIAGLEQYLDAERAWTGATLNLRLLLVRCHLSSGNLHIARVMLEEIEQRAEPLEQSEIQTARAAWHVEAHEFSRALAVLDGLESMPNSAPIHVKLFLRHRALLGLERLSEALETLERAKVAALERLRGFPTDRIHHALQHALELKPLHEAWQQLGTRQTVIALPTSDDSSQRGKSARAHVRVHWTPWEYGDTLIGDSTRRRQHQLERLIREAGQQGASATLEALRQAVGVSLATVKRDLVRLRLKTGSPITDTRETRRRDDELLGNQRGNG